MTIQLPELKKRYYTTGEVSKFFNITRATVRYWEMRFSILQAHRFGNGERRFTADQVLMFQKIHELVKVKGYTLKGAVKEITENKKWYRNKDKTILKLKEIKSKLETLRVQI